LIKKRRMISTELSLVVPEIKEIRYSIRREVEAWFSLQNIIPPVSYDSISGFAAQLLEEHGWDKTFKAFVMVCCGNAIWRTVVGVVPFNRRILLLPHCLKNSRLCKGQQDEMGLLCSECGNCNISGILREAENLGYVAIVTEGTSVAARLIESGKVDAVVGVGCMDVLQKMFISVSKFSIPSIGIPLLSCGCTDTSADTEWIKEEIYHIDKTPAFRLLNLNYLRNRTSSIFGEEQLRRIFEPSDNSTEELIFESGGKRLRPLLTVLANEAFCNQIETHNLNHLALSVECFHKASLIHDDIEDNDETRYGKETLHARYGIPVAINIGDLLIGEGYRLIADTSLPSDKIRECIKLVSYGHRKLSVGQGIELMSLRDRKILSVNETLRVFEYKTATAFKVSLLLGATAGGADSNSLELLESYSRLIGIAYQIKDDLEDFIDPAGEFEINKPSVLISLLSEKLTPDDKEIFNHAHLSNKFEIIQQLVDVYKIRQSIEDLLKDYIKESKECLGNFQNIGLKIALHEILGKIFKDYI
jgi:geranylgeranyl diphosphate synthase type II